ncbi:MAG: Lrp/AsnC ligand binding domain-containing protein [Candidatus Aureabacteria bacterium]|jgi:DNA-binding Lrp family transcriptional regulator|nr:Lrp/AsnC ligand binding domain-containing protein [Candidatus Auribacterota bacterium]
MAVAAYIFVEATQGKAIEICEEINKIKGVKSAHAVTGPYDIIVLVEGDDVNVLGEFIVSRIQNVPGVLRTMTNIIVE